jgi:hypothetical protein
MSMIRSTANVKARERWGPRGYAIQIHSKHEVGRWLDDPRYVPCRRERLGVGETWEEAFADAERNGR